MKQWLRRMVLGPEDGDGMGQGLLTDLRWVARFRRCGRVSVVWARPTPDEARWWEAHPVLGRFADECCAVAVIEGRRAAVMERIWFGWPDPPEFIWFVLAADGGVWAARDFDRWPAAWVRPGEAPTADSRHRWSASRR